MRVKKLKQNAKKLKGFTLLEMIISVAIIGVVITLVGVTLSTLIRTSMVSTIKQEVRDESDLIFDLLEKNIKQSDPANIFIYKSSNIRKYVNGEVVTYNANPSDVVNAYSSSLPEGSYTSSTANEIHLLPYKSTRWICIGYFKTDPADPNSKGYIVKTTAPTLSFGAGHSECFNNSASAYKMNAIVMNSDFNNIVKFNLSYYKATGDNSLLTVDMSLKPTKKYGGQDLGTIDRQLVASTQKLTKN